ncbi:uncharacterized protein L969DRAFT_43380 [Mixia osmundae IAM 14324]|uniref:Uncharacterized protein n=1 Tax=Mixia osmundae (strain CBS 9802 / IAM 14324 / JCM 22182 / KY 12970) TaxID=764103 RepID=G7DZW7_MIXOS|nr:uncharacterized protein L969DRAFT_43380 [Mixia osmundae IAM 14324]KEI42119.1 hypothetical protein L969DRAFT_43380 [Mixia osmundae IAM 14324]GAA96127.1 hypothetical protein E5Q_02788 [Mixia osmundae IAM 14324]
MGTSLEESHTEGIIGLVRQTGDSGAACVLIWFRLRWREVGSGYWYRLSSWSFGWRLLWRYVPEKEARWVRSD